MVCGERQQPDKATRHAPVPGWSGEGYLSRLLPLPPSRLSAKEWRARLCGGTNDDKGELPTDD